MDKPVEKVLAYARQMNLSPRQDSTISQLTDLLEIANALKMYDAADGLEKMLKIIPRRNLADMN